MVSSELSKSGAGRRPLVVGNWKMNGTRVSNAELLSALRSAGPFDAEVSVCCPFPYLADVILSLQGSGIGWGAQDCSHHEPGAHTGDVAAVMLAEFGCRHVIVGHSERRVHHAESDLLVADKAKKALAHGLTPKPPQDVIDSAKSLEFRSVICVNLMLDMPRMTKDTWIYCHDDGLGFARLHEPKNWSPAMVPDASKTSVVLEYFCTTGDAVWNKTDDAIVEWAVSDLAKLGLITRDKVIGGFCVRAKEAYPVYSMGYDEKLKKMKDYIQPFDRLAIVGRGGTFRYNNADHSVEMGLLTAQMIRGLVDKNDIMRVNTDLEYGEKGLVQGELPEQKTPVSGRA